MDDPNVLNALKHNTSFDPAPNGKPPNPEGFTLKSFNWTGKILRLGKSYFCSDCLSQRRFASSLRRPSRQAALKQLRESHVHGQDASPSSLTAVSPQATSSSVVSDGNKRKAV